MKKCLVCKEDITDKCCCFTKQGPLCVDCVNTLIDVYKISEAEEGNSFYTIDLKGVVDMFECCDYDDGYKIIKKEMTAVEYYNLPKFEGF
ncbi:MAG: hypothetical protein WC143_07885 [Eubacteriales bacterium]